MKTMICLVLLGIHGAAAVTHSMTYIITGVSGLDEFPEHNEVGLVNGQEFVHYDSDLKKIIPKSAWIEKNMDADYWDRETQRNINNQQVFQANIATVMQRFSQTGGVHTWQMMVGCEWDDETREVNGYWQYGYDGEDFILLDLKTETWIAPTPQAIITKHKWDNDKALIAQTKNYLTQICPEWLKKHVNYGRSSLMRTVLPSVSLLQKTPSSPVSCHATGFYPDRVDMFWRKDGEKLHEDVNHGEILPNNDGTFQMSVDLNISSVKPEDWNRYDCVFQLSGFNEDIVTGLEKPEIRTNWGETEIRDVVEFPTAAVIGAVVGLFILLGLYIIGVIFWRRRHNNTELLPTAAIGAVVGLSVLLFIPLFILLVLYIFGLIVWTKDYNSNIGFIPAIKFLPTPLAVIGAVVGLSVSLMVLYIIGDIFQSRRHNNNIGFIRAIKFLTTAVIGAVVGLFVLLGLYIAGVITWRRQHNNYINPFAAIKLLPTPVIGAVVGLFVLLGLCIAGVIFWRRRHNNTGFKPAIKHCSKRSVFSRK